MINGFFGAPTFAYASPYGEAQIKVQDSSTDSRVGLAENSYGIHYRFSLAKITELLSFLLLPID